MEPRRIGYVVSRFPKLSETFVLREVDALERLGWSVRLFPLLRGREPVVHADAVPWVRRTTFVPVLSVAVVIANLALAVRSPRAWVGLWGSVVRGYAQDPAAMVRALVLLPSCIHLASVVRREGIPQLHAHFATYPLLACWVVHRLTGTPYSVTVHAHDLFAGRAMLAEKLAGASRIVAISEYNRAFLAREVDPQLLARTEVVRCGVDAERYAPAVGDRPPHAQPRLLSVGSLEEHKGQRHLVAACRILLDRGHDLRCDVVGEGPERKRLQQHIAATGTGEVVTLLGARREDEVARLLALADVYVQPSVVAADGQMEGIPVALMEAMAAGLPVVATELSGVPELVRHGRTGWLAPPGNAVALADALEQVLRAPSAAAQRAAAGRAHVEEVFDLRSNVVRLSAVLQTVQPSPRREVLA